MVEAADAATYAVLDGQNHFHQRGGAATMSSKEDEETARLAVEGGSCTEPALPTKRPHLLARWKILVLLCLGLIGSYYCYDIPTAINVVMGPYYIPRMGQSRYNLLYNSLYSVYSWPNVVLPLLGGYFSDVFGVRLTTVIFAFLILVGQIIFATGITIEDDDTAWGIMLFGRVVFGFGGESLSVSMSAMIAQWFQGKEIALALGMNLALARYGSVINDEVSLALAKHFSMAWALWAGVGVCVMSLLAAVWAYYIDLAAVQVLRENRKTIRRTAAAGKSRSLRSVQPLPGTTQYGAEAGGGGAAASAADDDQVQLRLRNGPAGDGDYDSGSSPAPDRRSSEASSLLLGEDDDPDKEGLEDETIDLRAIFLFPTTFWVLTLSCLTVYCAVLPFNNIASSFLKLKWDFTDVQANTYMLVIYLTAGSLSPFLGAAIDNVGQRARLNVLAAVMIGLVHAALGFTHWNPIVPLVTLGLTYCIYASALWPSIALVVPEEYAATAYGLVTAVQNLGLAAVPLAVGRLQASCPDTYTCVEVFFVAAGVAGTISGIALNFVDSCAEHPVLNLSAAQLQALNQRKEAEQEERKLEEQGLLAADVAERGSVSGYSMQGMGSGGGAGGGGARRDGDGLAVGLASSGMDSPTFKGGSDGGDGGQRIPRASDASSGRKAREAGFAEDSPLATSLLPTPTLGGGAGARPSALDDFDLGR